MTPHPKRWQPPELKPPKVASLPPDMLQWGCRVERIERYLKIVKRSIRGALQHIEDIEGDLKSLKAGTPKNS